MTQHWSNIQYKWVILLHCKGKTNMCSVILKGKSILPDADWKQDARLLATLAVSWTPKFCGDDGAIWEAHGALFFCLPFGTGIAPRLLSTFQMVNRTSFYGNRGHQAQTKGGWNVFWIKFVWIFTQTFFLSWDDTEVHPTPLGFQRES